MLLTRYNIGYMVKLADKLKNLPSSPGVYLHKSASGEIIYVGKAAILKNRVRQYFQKSRDIDAKTRALVLEIADTDWLETESEIDALFLESELVKRYKPRYNILLRDDKSQIFVRIDMKNKWPHVSFTRNPSDDEAEYFGPFYNGHAVKKALRYLRRIFPHFVKPPIENMRPGLDSHIGLEPSPEMSSDQYKTILRQLIRYINGGRKDLIRDLEKDMKKAAEVHDFETAARLRNRIRNLGELQQRIMFGDKEFIDISKDYALQDIKELFNLSATPKRIEGYDVSHMGGTNVVASMVVFSNGVSDRNEYRKFKTKIEHNNDFYNMNETLLRRLNERNLKSWGVPDLILIDGGKGQLDAALKARAEKNQNTPMIGLAKKQEQIILMKNSGIMLNYQKLNLLKGIMMESDSFITINLPTSSHIVKLLQRIRDESHRFAVSYHSVLKRRKMTDSELEAIPSIGPATRKKLIKSLGSLKAVKETDDETLKNLVGEKKMKLLRQYL